MHFTLLTSIMLPETTGGARRLPASLPLNDLVSAMRQARFGDKAMLDGLDGTIVNKQLQFERLVEGIVLERMYPYWENINDTEYMEFIDCTEECKEEYETRGDVMVRLVNGQWISEYDPKFTETYEVYDGKVYQRTYGPMRHRKRTKKAKRMRTATIPFRKRYADYKEYAEEHSCFVKKDDTDAYGYYINPNAEFDWFQIGGRWPNRFLVKSDCCDVYSGELSFFLKDERADAAPDGYCWVTGARKKDIAWDVMKELFIQQERETFLKCENCYKAGKLPECCYDLTITERGITSWGKLIYDKDQSFEEHLQRQALSEEYQYPFSTYAVLTDDGWNNQREVECADEEKNGEDKRQWDQVVEKYIASLPEDAVLVSLDCHI